MADQRLLREITTENSLRHGNRASLYIDVLLPGEELIYNDITVGDLADEIRLCKLRLRRTLLLEQQVEASGSGFFTTRSSSEAAKRDIKHITPGRLRVKGIKVVKEYGKVVQVERTYVAPDFNRLVDQLLRRISSLEGQRKLLLTGDDTTPEEKAQHMRDLMKQMQASIASPPMKGLPEPIEQQASSVEKTEKTPS